MPKFHISQNILTNYAQLRQNQLSMFVGMKIAPFVPVMKESDIYPIWGNESITIDGGGYKRAPSTKAQRVKLTLSEGTYTALERSVEIPLDWRELEFSDAVLDLKKQHTRIVQDKLMLNHEKDVADLLFNTTTFAGFTAALAGVAKWSDPASDPRDQVLIAANSIRKNGVVNPRDISLLEIGRAHV